jgi:protoheme IX farnesyltransferase
MKRTEGRPIPGGRIAPGRALAFGILLSAAAVAYFAFFLNAAAAAIGAAALLSYVFVYTPLKRRTRLSAWVGAVPGALPPLVGWAAARGGLDPEAWSLFALLFVWQFPHFLVIGWIYREDYARAGFPVLAHADPTGRQTARQIALFSAALFAAVWLPSAAGLTGPFYTAAAAALGAAFLGMALFLAPGRLVRYAKRFAFASVVLLPLLGAAMVADRLLGAAARS